MDLNVWIVIPVMLLISVSHGTVFWKLFNVSASTVDDMCHCMNMMTIDCMLSWIREKFKTKMSISSNYVVQFIYNCINVLA